MNIETGIPILTLSTHYEVDPSFFTNLSEIGLIEIYTFEDTQYVYPDAIYEIEKMVRLHQDLKVNLEGIDVVFNLLQKIEDLQNELIFIKNRLRLYEG